MVNLVKFEPDIDYGARASLTLISRSNGWNIFRQPVDNTVTITDYIQAHQIQSRLAARGLAPATGIVGICSRKIPTRSEEGIGIGTTVRQVVKSNGNLDPLVASHYFWRVLKTVEILENIGAVHRDLGYQNLLLDLEGEIYVGDWDEARWKNNLGAKGSCTPVFTSPEEISDENNTNYVDLHAAVVSGFKMLTGRYPFASEGIRHPLVLKYKIAKSYREDNILGLNKALKVNLSEREDADHLIALDQFFAKFTDMARFERLSTARDVLSVYEHEVMVPYVFSQAELLVSQKKTIGSLFYLPGVDTESSVRQVE